MVGIFMLFIIGNPKVFTRFDIYYSFMSTIPFFGIMALAMTPVVTLGEMDLSFPSVLAVSALVFGKVFTVTGNIWLAALVCVLIGLAAGIGIIFGGNLGTTAGAWIVAGFGLKVNLSAYAMPMLVFGIILVFQRARNLKGAGYILAGLGFLFLGIHYMKEGFDSFGQTIHLADDAMTGYLGVFAFAGIGILATVVMQSSHATLVLILAALAAQQISYENALALAVGSNVGTTITAIICALGSGVDGRRLAAAHLVFNFVTGLIAISFIYQLMTIVSWVSVHLGIAADNYTLQLAVFHTLFNTLAQDDAKELLDSADDYF